MIKELSNKIGEKVYACVNGNIPAVIGVAVFGITCAIVGHYGQMGFHLGWFLGLELPLYLFLFWVIRNLWRMYYKYEKENQQ